MGTATAIDLEQLRQFGIQPEDVLKIEGNPWLSSEQLTAIARQIGKFKLIDVNFDDVKGDQIVYKAVVTTGDDQTFGRSGVATVGEKLTSGDEVSAYDLAASRALRSALAMAGVDPFKTASVVKMEPAKKSDSVAGPRAVERAGQIRQLHALAGEKGLIVGSDYSAYRAWMLENFDTATSANFDEEQFALAINKLQQLTN
jgi:hypothetical protein